MKNGIELNSIRWIPVPGRRRPGAGQKGTTQPRSNSHKWSCWRAGTSKRNNKCFGMKCPDIRLYRVVVAYLFQSFPHYSTTFLNDEVEEMRRQGARLVLFAVHRPADDEFPPAFAPYREETVYALPARPSLFIARQLACL